MNPKRFNFIAISRWVQPVIQTSDLTCLPQAGTSDLRLREEIAGDCKKIMRRWREIADRKQPDGKPREKTADKKGQSSPSPFEEKDRHYGEADCNLAPWVLLLDG